MFSAEENGTYNIKITIKKLIGILPVAIIKLLRIDYNHRKTRGISSKYNNKLLFLEKKSDGKDQSRDLCRMRCVHDDKYITRTVIIYLNDMKNKKRGKKLKKLGRKREAASCDDRMKNELKKMIVQ